MELQNIHYLTVFKIAGGSPPGVPASLTHFRDMPEDVPPEDIL
jgi:hypothetical protein